MLRGNGSYLAAARFSIVAPLGTGGSGAVYEALDTRTGTRVAVKVLDDASADNIARFKQEFRTLSDCHHANLVGLKELIEQDGRWLIVMELVPGTDFLEYVRGPRHDDGDPHPSYDEPRLRTALVGMVEGLRALHAFGVVHRDLKPSNVRVRPDGRAVLLDFGLATSIDPKQQSTHTMALGTVVYMAPEQAAGEAIGQAADLYSLGVCLFEALTGRAPFEGENAIKILLDKQRIPAARASSLGSAVPADLDELCAQLLETDPHKRPSADEALSVLTRTLVVTSERPTHGAPIEETFAGREGELTHLDRALARTHEGELRVMLIEGESGVGKSELVSEFVRRTLARHPKLVALRGRCYENEQVSYKAFDGCIDDLSKLLRRMRDDECNALMPPHAALLAQLFPILRHVKAIAKTPSDGSSADPTARRLEAFRALSQLLSKLAEDRPVVLVLDDLQWADAESFRLLSSLSQQDPRPPILLLATVRSRDELDASVNASIEEVRKWKHTDVVSLLGLPREHAKALAKTLLAPSAPAAWLDVIAEESQGHPLFMSELLQYAQSRDFKTRGKLTLEAALRARIERLDRRARELLEVVAVAGRPHPAAVFASALSTNIDEPMRSLLAAKLLRQRRGHELGCYHDRIRHGAVELIAKSRLPALHHSLAASLEQLPNADASEQARHWDLSGQQERAVSAYETAASKAFDALAFARAAQLCERALELVSSPFDERVQRLTVQRADALACAGRSGEAAVLYQQAADGAQGEARIQLRSRAAMHLMLSAKVGPGFEAARELLLELGFSLPRSVAAATVRYLWDSLCVACGTTEVVAREPSTSAKDRIAVDVLREMLYVLGAVHPLAAFALSMQYVRHAARVDSRLDASLSLTRRAWQLAVQGGLARARKLLEKSRESMAGQTDPKAVASHAYVSGSTLTMGWDWVSATSYLQLAQRLVQEHCPDNPWLHTSIRFNLGANWYHQGQHLQLAREMERWLAEVRERNDVLGIALLTGVGYGFARHLMDDAPERAIGELEQAGTALPAQLYSFSHYGQLIGTTYSLLYRGGPSALRYLDQHEAAHRRAFLLRTGGAKQTRSILRAYAALSAYASADNAARRPLLKQATRAALTLRSARSPLSRAISALTSAQIEAIQGRRAKGLAHARSARAQFHALHHAYERTALYLEGILEAGSSGLEKCESALLQLRSEGWREPLRALAITAPLHLLLSAAKSKIASTPRLPVLLGRYEVTGQLGAGGFGSVVAARDVDSGHGVALKELVGDSGASLERFKQEFRALSEVHHENVVQLEALFEHEGRWYIAMELVPGHDLASYLRESGPLEAARLRAIFTGLADGLSALHLCGFVHRDVKPENVMITPEGRAVLIDFGAIARTGDRSESPVLGHPEYAAPEQLKGAPGAPSADVYALGACLYAAMNDTPPVQEQALLQLVGREPRTHTRAASALGLEQVALLCQRMLSPSPSARPSLDEVLRILTGARAPRPKSSRPPLPRGALDEGRFELELTGREPELERLEALFVRTREAGLVLALVEGESGLGKSSLVDFYVHCAKEATPGMHVLKSRCYENEQVAFKAFDGAVDQLAQLLRGLSLLQCQTLLPRRAALLAQVFPVLASVPAIAGAAKKGLPADPAARKQAASECFIQLLTNLCAQGQVMLVVDDLQWADRESFDLLRALLSQEVGPSMLILATVRPANEIDPAVASELESLRMLPKSETLALHELPEHAATVVARRLLGASIDEPRLAALVRESRGHPLFLRELVEHERSGLGVRRGELTLDAALGARIDELGPDARSLLALVALADKPYGVQVYAHALTLRELPREALVALLSSGLLRRRGDKLVCYHDRIRRVMTARFEPVQRAEAAYKLAAALHRDRRSDAAERARLWDEAGETTEAVDAYEEAGDQALEGLAFARAEQHYARAIALSSSPLRDPRWRRLRIARGHALVRAGRSADAARMFQLAAEQAEGEESVRLRIWAAQHLIQSAQVEAGLRAASQLLTELGLSLPEGDGNAKLRIVWQRVLGKLRGKRKHGHSSAVHERLVLDALHGLSAPVRAVSYARGSALVAQYLPRALRAGDPVHAARALAYAAFAKNISAPQRSHEQLFERSRSLAEATGDPVLMAELDLTQGFACSAARQYRSSCNYLWRAHELLLSQCPGQPWLLTAARVYLGLAWFTTGNFQELRRHSGAWLDEARARDDRYAVAALAGFGAASFRHVLDDDPEGALSELDAAMAPWPNETFTTNHYGAFITAANILATCEDGPRFLRRVDAQRDRLERAVIMRTPSLRLGLLTGRLRALLQCVETPGSRNAAAIVARVRVELRDLKRISVVSAPAMAVSYDGWLCMLAGDRAGALRFMRQASELFAGAEHFSASGVRFMLGMLEGGERGREQCDAVRAQIRSEGFENERRGLTLRLPGSLKLLETLCGTPASLA